MTGPDEERRFQENGEPDGRDWEEWFSEEEEEGEPPKPLFQRPAFRRTLAAVLALALFAQAAALFPQIFSLAAIRFLSVSAQLSQSPEVKAYKEAVVVIRSGRSKGTGFIISENGLIATNRHVVEGADALLVHLADGRVYRGAVLSMDEEADLALVGIEAEGLPRLKLAASYDGASRVPVYIIGNPLFFNGIANAGHTIGFAGSDSSARIMALDAPIYKGNSGSPVLTEEGEVIGIVYAVGRIEHNGEKRRAGLAVPVDLLHAHLSGALP